MNSNDSCKTTWLFIHSAAQRFYGVPLYSCRGSLNKTNSPELFEPSFADSRIRIPGFVPGAIFGIAYLMLPLPWFLESWSKWPNSIAAAPRTLSPWQRCPVIAVSVSVLALVWSTAAANPDYQTSVKEKCTKIQGADEKALHEAGQATARGMRDAYNEADRIAGELADLDKKVREAAQAIDKHLTPLMRETERIRREGELVSGDVRFWRTKLNATQVKIKPLQERLSRFANPYGEEQAELKEQIAALRREQKEYDKKLAKVSAKLQKLVGEAQDVNRYVDAKPLTREYLPKKKAEFESAKAERQRKFEEFEDAKAAAKTALLIHNGVKACIKAELDGGGFASTEDIVAASKSALQQLWAGHAVLFKEIKRGNEALPDRYKASVENGKKYYSHTIFVIPGDKVEEAKQKFGEMIQQGSGEDGQTLLVDGLDVGVPTSIPTKLAGRPGQFQTAFIEHKVHVVAKRRASILCGRLVITFEHYQDTGYTSSQKFDWKRSEGAVDWHQKHPATPTYNRLKPHVKAETERYVRSLVASLREAKACRT